MDMLLNIRHFAFFCFPLFSLENTVLCLFWAPQKRLNYLIIQKLSRFLFILRAYYVQKMSTEVRRSLFQRTIFCKLHSILHPIISCSDLLNN